MQDTTNFDLICESTTRLFGSYDPLGQSERTWPADLWQDAEEAGLPLALLSEKEGGFGFSAIEALAPVRIAAAHAVPLPLGETMLANHILALAGLDPVEGPAAIVHGGAESLVAVPFGRHIAGVVVLSPEQGNKSLALYRPGPEAWRHGENIAGEARDCLSCSELGSSVSSAEAPIRVETLYAMLAMLRATQMAGAMSRALEMTLRYAGERQQFGRSLGRFQAIQHNCAIMAGHVAAACAGADMAITALPKALSVPEVFTTLAAAAKVRAGEGATQVAALAHQVHGAIGFSHEYALHPLSRRLWSWRDEDGTEADWSARLSSSVLTLPERGLWAHLTSLHEEVA